jgi:hypothetical protein
MKQSEIFRENAENCLQLAERAKGMPAFRRYSRMARAWTALAHEQDWLDGEIPPCGVAGEGAADGDFDDDPFFSGDGDRASENGDVIGYPSGDKT